LFEKILIANRGEIAIRIIRACREMGIKSVAVYSKADKNSLHVKLADEAVCLGGELPSESYLNFDKIMDVAHRFNVDAIHPGYGFLAENYLFAKRCEKEGFIFIGPSSDVLKLSGDKVSARLKAAKAKVPLVPGSLRPLRSPSEVIKIARKIGYPVLLKPTGGGGGIGMKLVRNEEEVEKAFRISQIEAEKAFGDYRIYIEKYLTHPKHIEVQIMGDQYGNIFHLYERECSVQRRRQKVIEEAPSISIKDKVRKDLCKKAVKLAEEIGYNSIGTVEFAYQDGKFYFLEINARIQVEHGVTEFITGIDLVKEQIRIAYGEELKYKQKKIKMRGHSIECRVIAEDMFDNFSISTGKIVCYKEPSGPWVRVDSGVCEGSEVSPFYDPLLSKVIVWGRDREEAVSRMRRALDEYTISGVKTNIPLLKVVLSDEEFLSGKYDVLYLERNLERLLNKIEDEEMERIASLALAIKKLGMRYVSKNMNFGARTIKYRNANVDMWMGLYNRYESLRWSKKVNWKNSISKA